jgi:hypothetical protein
VILNATNADRSLVERSKDGSDSLAPITFHCRVIPFRSWSSVHPVVPEVWVQVVLVLLAFITMKMRSPVP